MCVNGACTGDVSYVHYKQVFIINGVTIKSPLYHVRLCSRASNIALLLSLAVAFIRGQCLFEEIRYVFLCSKFVYTSTVEFQVNAGRHYTNLANRVVHVSKLHCSISTTTIYTFALINPLWRGRGKRLAYMYVHISCPYFMPYENWFGGISTWLNVRLCFMAGTHVHMGVCR